MTVQVQYQKKGKAGSMQGAGAVIGGIAGAIGGGPAGAMKGAQTGGSIGGAVGGAFDNQTAGPDAVQNQQNQNMAPQAAPAADPQQTLREAYMALQNQPPEVQQQHAPAIQAAMLKLRREQA